MDRAIVAESARWGDMHASTPYHRTQWVTEGQSVINTFLAGRTSVFLNQLKSAGLYPNVNAPTFSQNGGNVPTGTNLLISGSGGAVYYTLDGSDPRNVSGGVSGTLYISPIQLTADTTVKARVLSGGNWSALVEASFTTVSLPGDYNSDLVVDTDDYLVWKQNFGSTTILAADGNSDGIVDARDFTVWRNNLGASALVAAVAEPAAVVPAEESSAAVVAAGPDEDWYLAPERRGSLKSADALVDTSLAAPLTESPVAPSEPLRTARGSFTPATRSELVDAVLGEWEKLAGDEWEVWDELTLL
jgi:hypothetical protein